MLNKILICPCTGDEPFFVSTLETAVQYVATEEYYAVDMSTFSFVLEDGSIGHKVSIIEEEK